MFHPSMREKLNHIHNLKTMSMLNMFELKIVNKILMEVLLPNTASSCICIYVLKLPLSPRYQSEIILYKTPCNM